MILVILIAYGFYRGAKSRELPAVLWTILGGLSYFIGQILTGFILGATNPQILHDKGALTGIALFSGLLASGITFFIMHAVYTRKNEKEIFQSNEQIIDDSNSVQSSKEESLNSKDDI